MEAIKTVQTAWELERKSELVKLGQSTKPWNEILSYLQSEIENAARMTNFDYRISCFKNDGIYQLNRSIEQIVGVSHVQNNRGPSGDVPMNTIDIQLADGTRKKVPYGTIDLPDMGEGANIQISYSSDQKFLHVRGKCQFKFSSLVDSIIEKTKELLNTDSIYRNQTFEINAGIDNGQPQIINLSSYDKELMILSAETEGALSPLKARILHAEKCKANGIPIKFGALLSGPYGCPKSKLL